MSEEWPSASAVLLKKERQTGLKSQLLVLLSYFSRWIMLMIVCYETAHLMPWSHVLLSKPVLSPERPWVRQNTTCHLHHFSLKSFTQRIAQNIQRKKPEDTLFRSAVVLTLSVFRWILQVKKKRVMRFIRTSKRRLTEQWHAHWNTTSLSLFLIFVNDKASDWQQRCLSFMACSDTEHMMFFCKTRLNMASKEELTQYYKDKISE